MNDTIWNIVKNSMLFFCVIFSTGTLISSIWQLYKRQTTDTNLHIIIRAAFCLIGVIAITIMDTMNFDIQILSYIVPYFIIIPLVFILIRLWGKYEKLHQKAYRDVFLNVTISYIVIAIIVAIL